MFNTTSLYHAGANGGIMRSETFNEVEFPNTYHVQYSGRSRGLCAMQKPTQGIGQRNATLAGQANNAGLRIGSQGDFI